MILTSILLLVCLSLWAQDGRKMSRDIRELVKQVNVQGHRTQGVDVKETVRAMVKCTGTAEAVMDDYGCQVVSRIGNIYVADIPVCSLQAMAEDGRVERIENHRGGKVLMDVAPKWLNLPALSEDTRLPQAFTGKGVMLGIIDVGLEVTHPNFYTTDGTRLRVTRFLDQFAADDEIYGQPTPLGREYTTEADIKGKGYSGDSHDNYHGTHCLGIAAGTGYKTTYRGVAYDAEVIAVDSKVAGDSAYGSANELALMKYVFDYADERGMPCVITYSIGFNALPADCVLFEEAIAQMTGPGHVLVVAAGNESNNGTYLTKRKGEKTAGLVMKALAEDPPTAFLYTSDDFRLKFFTMNKDSTAKLMLADSLTYLSTEGTVEKDLVDKRIKVEKMDTLYTISYTMPGDTISEVGLAMVIEGEDCAARVVSEMHTAFNENKGIDNRLAGATNDHNVGLPGCLPSVVTVGALNARKNYINVKGDTIANWGGRSPEGTIAKFSSQGPTMDGLVKPDVVAPGVNIHASANSYMEGDYGKNLVAKTTFEGREYPWIAISGTSMATPCMAGIVALWLQANPGLSPDDVKRIIRETSHPMGEGVPNNTYGYGLADAYAGVLNILGLPNAIHDLSLHQPEAITIRPVEGGVRLLFGKAPAKPFSVRIYALSGQLVGEHTMQANGATQYDLPLAQPSGIYAVQINSPETGVTGSELIRVMGDR